MHVLMPVGRWELEVAIGEWKMAQSSKDRDRERWKLQRELTTRRMGKSREVSGRGDFFALLSIYSIHPCESEYVSRECDTN